MIFGIQIHDPVLAAVGVSVGIALAIVHYRRRVVSRTTVVVFFPESSSSTGRPESWSLEARAPGETLELRFAGKSYPIAPLEDVDGRAWPAGHLDVDHPDRYPEWARILEATGMRKTDAAEVWTQANGRRELRVFENGKWRFRSRLSPAHRRAEASA